MTNIAMECAPVDDQILIYEVSDDALEAAFGMGAAAATTLFNAGSYCLTCRPQDLADETA